MHGGEAFRSAVFNRNRQAVDFFLAHGVDINFGARDQVFSDSATPLLVAARNRDLNLCRLLVEHGADVSLSNRDGDRPIPSRSSRTTRRWRRTSNRWNPGIAQPGQPAA